MDSPQQMVLWLLQFVTIVTNKNFHTGREEEEQSDLNYLFYNFGKAWKKK